MIKRVEVLALQGVLEERIAHAAADAQILYRLEVERGARDAGEPLAQPAHYLGGADLSFSQRLEPDEHPRRVDRAGLPATECGYGLHRGILYDARDELGEQFVQGLKGRVLVGDQRAHQPAGVLLGEKALGYDDE